MEWNQQHGWKPANYNLQTSPFEPAEESLCFLRGPLEWMTEQTNVNVSCIFVLMLHLIAKHGNGSEEISGRWQIQAQANKLYLLHVGVVCNVLNTKTLSGETFCFLGKRVLPIFQFWPLSNLMFFFFMSCWLVLNQLSRNVLLF